jgi:hypothetical protein
MIKFKNQVPTIYTKASRDFQYLSWLIDIVLNSVKHNVDSLYDLPNTQADPKLTELLAMTLGFKVKRNYNQKQLAALVAALPKILKYKGTETAIYYAGNALIAASGAVGNFHSEVVDGELQATLPEKLVDIALFNDLLPYILPAGMSSRIIRTNAFTKGITTQLNYSDKATALMVQDLKFDEQSQQTNGLATMFDPATAMTENVTFANFINESYIVNAGLLDNSLIAAVTEPLIDPHHAENTTDQTNNETPIIPDDAGEQTTPADNIESQETLD